MDQSTELPINEEKKVIINPRYRKAGHKGTGKEQRKAGEQKQDCLKEAAKGTRLRQVQNTGKKT